MRRFAFLAAVLGLSLSACTPNDSTPPNQVRTETKPVPTAVKAVDPAVLEKRGLALGAPIQHANLIVFPITSARPQPPDRLLTLDEGLKSGTVEIREVGAETAEATAATTALEPQQPASSTGEVNRLCVVNRSDKPLYLMPGEVIVGGSQDRTIAKETLVQNTGKPVYVDVYCVEHGRWGQRSEAENTEIYTRLSEGSEDAQTKVKLAAEGKFVATAGALDKASRLAAQSGEGQQQVWSRVAGANSASGVAPDSGAFTTNYLEGKVLSELEPYVKAIEEAVARQEHVVGVVVAVNGKPEAVDVFESTALFRKLWPKLLRSYALDSWHAAGEQVAGTSCDLVVATSFLAEVLHGPDAQHEQTTGGLVVTRRETERAASFSFSDQSAAAPATAEASAGFGGFGGSVHSTGFAK